VTIDNGVERSRKPPRLTNGAGATGAEASSVRERASVSRAGHEDS
jgi:hypothetical protein